MSAIKNLTKPTSDPRSGLRSERFDINIAYLGKRAPAGAEKREKLEPGENWHGNRGNFSATKIQNFLSPMAGHVTKLSGPI